jgi:hypothetical protein
VSPATLVRVAGSAGASKNPFKPQGAYPAWINTRSGAGLPDTLDHLAMPAHARRRSWPPRSNATTRATGWADQADNQRVPAATRLAPTNRPTPSTACWPGHDGTDDIKPNPANATTDDTNTNDHEVRLQY